MAKKRKRARKPIPLKQLKEYYLVKFEMPKLHEFAGLRFGVVNNSSFDEDVKRQAKKGFLLVSDCEIPTSWIVSPDRVEKLDVNALFDEAEGGCYHWLDKKYEEAVRRALASKTIVHQIMHFGVADGSATYVVVEDRGQTVRVEWRGYGNLDRYTEPLLGWGGTMPRERIEPHLNSKRALRVMLDQIIKERELRVKRQESRA